MSTLTTGENAIWSRDAVVFKIGCTSSEIKPYKRTIELKMGVGLKLMSFGNRCLLSGIQRL